MPLLPIACEHQITPYQGNYYQGIPGAVLRFCRAASFPESRQSSIWSQTEWRSSLRYLAVGNQAMVSRRSKNQSPICPVMYARWKMSGEKCSSGAHPDYLADTIALNSTMHYYHQNNWELLRLIEVRHSSLRWNDGVFRSSFILNSSTGAAPRQLMPRKARRC